MPTCPVLNKFTLYAGIKIFNSLLLGLTVLKNEKAKFKLTLRKYLNTLSLYSVAEFFYVKMIYKVCPSESGTEVGAPLFPAVELCDFSGRWQCMSGEIWYTLDSGSVLLTETEAR